jgi:hypothetical protein
MNVVYHSLYTDGIYVQGVTYRPLPQKLQSAQGVARAYGGSRCLYERTDQPRSARPAPRGRG